MQRRAFMNMAGGFTAALALEPLAVGLGQERKNPVAYPDPAVEVIDPRFAKYRVGNAAVERLYTGARWAAVWEIGTVFAFVLVLGFGRRPRRASAMMVFVVITAIACATSCGGSGGGSGGGSNPGTPAGTYYGVTVTATINGITQTMNNLTVVVQ